MNTQQKVLNNIFIQYRNILHIIQSTIVIK